MCQSKSLSISVALIAVLLGSGARADGQALVVIAHKNAGVTTVGRQDLGRVFMGQTKELGAKRATPAIAGDRAARTAILAGITGKSGATLENHFVKLELRGEGRWPPVLATATELIRQIAEAESSGGPAVIGCMLQAEYATLSPAQLATVVVVAVDGKRPGEGSYPLSNP